MKLKTNLSAFFTWLTSNISETGGIKQSNQYLWLCCNETAMLVSMQCIQLWIPRWCYGADVLCIIKLGDALVGLAWSIMSFLLQSLQARNIEIYARTTVKTIIMSARVWRDLCARTLEMMHADNSVLIVVHLWWLWYYFRYTGYQQEIQQRPHRAILFN
jgi:hypothetical protein